MFLIDLNQCYFKVVNGGQVWTHDLDELQWLIPDNEPVHVRRGQEVAIMPLTAVHQWLFPFGPFDINSDSFPSEYIDSVLRHRLRASDEWEEWGDLYSPDSPPQCGCSSCDGSCETCTFDQQPLRQIAYMKKLTRERSELLISATSCHNDDFRPEDIPF